MGTKKEVKHASSFSQVVIKKRCAADSRMGHQRDKSSNSGTLRPCASAEAGKSVSESRYMDFTDSPDMALKRTDAYTLKS